MHTILIISTYDSRANRTRILRCAELVLLTGTAHSRLLGLGVRYPDARVLGGPLTERNHTTFILSPCKDGTKRVGNTTCARAAYFPMDAPLMTRINRPDLYDIKQVLAEGAYRRCHITYQWLRWRPLPLPITCGAQQAPPRSRPRP